MKRKVAFLLAIVMMMAVLSGCGGSGNESKTSASEVSNAEGSTAAESGRDSVTIRVESPWATFDPMKASLYVDYYEINQMYESLMWVDDESVVQPLLAESWKVSDDGKEYIFNIRKGVKFHNGEELKASDVVFTYLKAMDEAALMSNFGPTNNVEEVDEYTVKLTLDNAFAPLLSFLANVRIVNETFYTEQGGELGNVACGTGPYKLVDTTPNVECSMEAFPDYWRGEAEIKNIKFTIITDDTTAAVSYMAGEVDFISTSASQFLEIESEPDKYSFKSVPTKHTALIYMNTEKAPFDNKTLRKAIQHAVDRDAMIQVAFSGYAKPAYLQGDESSFGVNYDYVQYYDYDLDKARELLAQAGYPDGVDLGTIITNSGTYMEKCAVVMQASLSEIGCTLEVVGMENTAMTDLTRSGDYGMMTGGQSFASDFAYARRQYHSEGIGLNNYSRMNIARLDELFELAEIETDSDKRLELYGEAIEIITEEAAMIPMFHKNLLFAWTKGLDCIVHPDSYMPYFVYNWSWS